MNSIAPSFEISTTDVNPFEIDTVLVQSDISDRDLKAPVEQRVTVTIYADLMKVKVSPLAPPAAPIIGIKKPITEFSRKSRKNFLEKLASLREAENGYFVTLTYPGRFDSSPVDVKRHIGNFRKALMRRFPAVGGFWRLELKARKSGDSEGVIVPHFHLLLFGVEAPYLPLLRQWIRHAWTRIVVGSDRGDLLRTQVDVITCRRHAMSYASKYAAKEGDDVPTPEEDEVITLWGRRWGTFGALDLTAALVVVIDRDTAIHIKRAVCSLLKARGSKYGKRLKKMSPNVGFAVFGVGDLSQRRWRDVTDSTAFRLLTGI